MEIWGYGPNSGTAMMLTLAEAVGWISEKWEAPARSIMIGHWDAEEQGVIGSTDMGRAISRKIWEQKQLTYMEFDGGVSGRNSEYPSAPYLEGIWLSKHQGRLPIQNSAKTDFKFGRVKNDEPKIVNLGGGLESYCILHACGRTKVWVVELWS